MTAEYTSTLNYQFLTAIIGTLPPVYLYTLCTSLVEMSRNNRPLRPPGNSLAVYSPGNFSSTKIRGRDTYLKVLIPSCCIQLAHLICIPVPLLRCLVFDHPLGLATSLIFY